jgi:hypothetical protein
MNYLELVQRAQMDFLAWRILQIWQSISVFFSSHVYIFKDYGLNILLCIVRLQSQLNFNQKIPTP